MIWLFVLYIFLKALGLSTQTKVPSVRVASEGHPEWDEIFDFAARAEGTISMVVIWCLVIRD